MPDISLTVEPQVFSLVLDAQQTLIAINETPASIVLEQPGVPGATGARGDTGPSGTEPGTSKQNAGLDAWSKGTLIYDVNSAQGDRAIASVALKKNVLGMAASTIVPSGAGLVQLGGLVTQLASDWDALLGTVGGLVPGATYFLSDTQAGVMTTSVPSLGHWLCRVGQAVNSTDFYLRIEPTIKL